MKLILLSFLSLFISATALAQTCEELFRPSNVVSLLDYVIKKNGNGPKPQPKPLPDSGVLPESPLKELYFPKSYKFKPELKEATKDDVRDLGQEFEPSEVFRENGVSYLLMTLTVPEIIKIFENKSELGELIDLQKSPRLDQVLTLLSDNLEGHRAERFIAQPHVFSQNMEIKTAPETFKIGLLFPVEVLNESRFVIKNRKVLDREGKEQDPNFGIQDFDSNQNKLSDLLEVIVRSTELSKSSSAKTVVPKKKVDIALENGVHFRDAVGVWIPQPLIEKNLVPRDVIVALRTLFLGLYFDASTGAVSKKFIYTDASKFPRWDDLKRNDR